MTTWNSYEVSRWYTGNIYKTVHWDKFYEYNTGSDFRKRIHVISLPGMWSKEISSVFVEHQCRPSGSDSVIQYRLNFPWNLKGNTQGVLGLGLSLAVIHFSLCALMLIKITKRTITEQILFMVVTQLVAWSSSTIFKQWNLEARVQTPNSNWCRQTGFAIFIGSARIQPYKAKH